ncbi:MULTISPECIES: 50S ribosomal protein L25/general stress protein Ctc [Comamonas]|jgi:large subunit ribosomal protein L25|uniref:Large ribosomal subunit protein bL25 n=3 Tax=Comamonas TaxID=283 RepID=A0ABY6A792_9BURK|nr:MULTISPECIES: 50S ribosomal protein L25/general stress protein Ctc [Comamonas]MCD2163780.1 50S ribosomal protein L25/general stress protein Ctc [Comamonas koreensis]PWB16296.1 50S ribosomal protein L25 [Comamonas sp. JNW]UXC20671.1 50S ribosomal protein L25/general stress protein Ctc [Comamonas sp. PR12]
MNVVAFARAKQGTGASRRLRNSGRTPGIIYGAAAEPQLIEVDHNSLWYALKKEAFHASVLELDLDGAKSQVLLRDVQYHPYKQLVLHIDFQRVDANTALTMKVPVHFSGAEESPAVKIDKCLVTPVVTEIQVICMPKDLPEFIAVDLSKLEKGSTVHLKDIALPKGVKLAAQTNPALVSVAAPAAAEPAEGEAPAA